MVYGFLDEENRIVPKPILISENVSLIRGGGDNYRTVAVHNGDVVLRTLIIEDSGLIVVGKHPILVSILLVIQVDFTLSLPRGERVGIGIIDSLVSFA